MIGRGMMQRIVDKVLGIAKESLKTLSQESFNNAVRFINGFSALVLAVLPGTTTVLEGIQGWELHPTFRAPRLPRWMEDGVSSFNAFIHDYDSDTESDTESEYQSGMEDNDSVAPSSPLLTNFAHFKNQLCKQTRTATELLLAALISAIYIPSPLLGFLEEIWKARTNCSYQVFSGRRRPPLTTRGSGTYHGLSQLRSTSSGSLTLMYGLASRHFSGVKDYMVPNQPGDRRRALLSEPKEDEKAETVDTATLGDSDPAPQKQPKDDRKPLNTDGRTCQDIITSLGYPYEALQVTTADGYVLLLERIPRRKSQKVLYLQHGLLDSSLGWVSNGVVGSQAFAAYDQGYDVFLGNLRGLASREHVEKRISSQRYWQYSVNEHGTQDITAMLTRVHEIKISELKELQLVTDDEVGPSNSANCYVARQPYSLCGVAHSLGGASILMYVVTRRLENKPHYLSRLVLLSPAGFHEDAPGFCAFLQYAVPVLAPIVTPFIPGLYIPTRVFRGLFNKLAQDFQNYPALGGLVQTLCSYLVGGDSSNWVGAIAMSHYNMNDMPGVSYRVGLHLAQMMRSKRFIMYDFGSARKNMEAYGTPYPLDIGAHYWAMDIPVDFVAGRKDKLIPKTMVRKHYETLKKSGCQASYQEFEYAHLDFTFSHREELLGYVMSRLLLVTPPKVMNGVGSLEQAPSFNVWGSKSSKKLNVSLARKSFKDKHNSNGEEEVSDGRESQHGELSQNSYLNGESVRGI